MAFKFKLNYIEIITVGTEAACGHFLLKQHNVSTPDKTLAS